MDRSNSRPLYLGFASQKGGVGKSTLAEVLQLLRNLVRDLRVETSITSYIENIILDHLKTHQELLNQIASQRRRDKTIDL